MKTHKFTLLLMALILALSACSTTNVPSQVSVKQLTRVSASPVNFVLLDLRSDEDKQGTLKVVGDTTFYLDKSMDMPPATLVANKIAELGDATKDKKIELIEFKSSYFVNNGTTRSSDQRKEWMGSMYGATGSLISSLLGSENGDICLCVIRIKMDGEEYVAVGKHQKGMFNFSDCLSKSISRSINDLWNMLDRKLYPNG